MGEPRESPGRAQGERGGMNNALKGKGEEAACQLHAL